MGFALAVSGVVFAGQEIKFGQTGNLSYPQSLFGIQGIHIKTFILILVRLWPKAGEHLMIYYR